MEGETSEISLPSFIVTTRSHPEVCMEQKRSVPFLGTEILVKDVRSPDLQISKPARVRSRARAE